MNDEYFQRNTSKAIKADQIKAFYAEFGTLNLAGALVFSLILIATYQFTSVLKVVPALLMVYAATFMRAYHIRQFRRSPDLKSPDQWGNLQTWYAALSGSGWGIGYALLLPSLPLDYQLLIFVVTTVSSAATISAGFSYLWPSRAFTITALLPQMLWLAIVGDKLHTVLFFLLMIFLAMALWQSFRRNRVFKDAVELRLQNEQLIKELLQQRDLVEQASRDKTRFLASASHDLRQPLSALVLFLDLLGSDRQMSSQSQNMVLRAHQAANSLSGLLSALLDISKLDASIVKPNRRSFAIQLLFNELESEFLPLAQNKGIRLSFAFSSALINSDPVLLGQILRNLISNALSYTTHGHVLVGCRHRWGMLSIEVHDTGIGIPEDQHQAIFTEFYQIGNKERDRQKGLGLGLAIVKRTSQLLGHSVTMRSHPGKGSCFVVTVPKASDFTYEVPLPFKPKTNQARLNAVGQRIAVIENEEDIRIGLQTVLQSWGCNVIAANSTNAILSMLENDEEPVTAIISDYSLSNSGNGIDAIIALRQRYDSTLPAILITGDTTRETYIAAQEANLPLLYKPVEIEVLHSALVSVLHTA
jgi:signal transduction histidine kinase